jgi:hypothetical protein
VLDDAYFAREIGYDTPQAVDISQVLVLPSKGALLAVFSPVDLGDWLLIEFVERAGQPHLRILAGCLNNKSGNIFPDGRFRDKLCDSQPDPRYPGNTWYSNVGRASFHGAYWIDYSNEQVHLVAQTPPDHFFETAWAPTPDRNALLVVYDSRVDSTRFKLCAVGVEHRKQTQCADFIRNASIGPLDYRRAIGTVPPFPSFAFETYDLDELPDAALWRFWLRARFDLKSAYANGLPLRIANPDGGADE